MHSTDSLEDGYVGSGTRLWHSIKKHGRENFKLEILEFLPDRESLKKREAEVITEKMLRDSMCMNLSLGGGDIRLTKEQYKMRNDKCKLKFLERMKDPEFKQKFGKAVSKSGHIKRSWITNREARVKGCQSGLKALSSPETMIKRKESFKQNNHQQGEKNSRFGLMWITNEVESKCINKTDSIPEGWRKGRVIKQLGAAEGCGKSLQDF
jgi:hypothetical protein